MRDYVTQEFRLKQDRYLARKRFYRRLRTGKFWKRLIIKILTYPLVHWGKTLDRLEDQKRISK